MKVLESIVFHVTVKYIFQGSYCTFSECSLVLTQCKVCIPSALHSFLNSPANSVPLSTQLFLGRFYFVIIVKNAQTVSLETFLFIPSASTVLSNMSWRTRRYFTPFLSLASLSTYSKSIHQSSFLNLGNAFMRLNLRVARVIFV